MKKIIIILSVFILMSGILSGCGQSSREQSQGDSADFVLGVFNMSTIDPANDYDGWSTIRYGVGETLFVLDDKLIPNAKLAEDYTVSDDGYTWTITIKDNVKFHNGNPVDGNAVKKSLERTVEMNERAAGDLFIESITADDNTIKITTTTPNPTLINSLCDPYACIIDVTADVDFSKYAVGTGPYMVKNFVENSHIELEPFTGYWDGTPKCDSLIVRNISDVDTLSMAMQNGELDAAYGVSYDSLSLFEDNPQFRISQAATTRVYMLYYNLQNKFMNDPIVRKAVSMAADKQSYSNVLLNNAGTPTKSAFPSYLPYGDDNQFDTSQYDPQAAKDLLAENGYVDSDGDGWLDKGGEKLSLKLITYSRTGLPIIAETLQSSLRDMGMDVSYELVDNVSAVLDSGEYDICAYAYVTTPTGDPHSYLNYVMGTGNGSNFGRFSNEKVDELLTSMASEFDAEKRAEYAIEIQKLALQDDSYCFMLHLNMALVMKSDVTGIEQSPVDYYIINVETGKK